MSDKKEQAVDLTDDEMERVQGGFVGDGASEFLGRLSKTGKGNDIFVEDDEGVTGPTENSIGGMGGAGTL